MNLIAYPLVFIGFGLMHLGTFATFLYGVIYMVTEGFLPGLLLATAGAFLVGIAGLGITMLGGIIAEDV